MEIPQRDIQNNSKIWDRTTGNDTPGKEESEMIRQEIEENNSTEERTIHNSQNIVFNTTDNIPLSEEEMKHLKEVVEKEMASEEFISQQREIESQRDEEYISAHEGHRKLPRNEEGYD